MLSIKAASFLLLRFLKLNNLTFYQLNTKLLTFVTSCCHIQYKIVRNRLYFRVPFIRIYLHKTNMEYYRKK